MRCIIKGNVPKFLNTEVYASVRYELYEDDFRRGEGKFVEFWSENFECTTIRNVIETISDYYNLSNSLKDWGFNTDYNGIYTTVMSNEYGQPLTTEEYNQFTNGKLKAYLLTIYIVFYNLIRLEAGLKDIETVYNEHIGEIV